MMDSDDGDTYIKHSGELIRFAAVLVGPSAAEDVFSTAVLKAFTADRWPSVDNRRAYLFRAVLHEASKHRRALQRRTWRESRAATPDQYEHNPADPEVLAAMRLLDVRERAVIFLTYWSDLAVREIADLLQVSSRTIERDLTSARRKLEVWLS